MPLNEAAATLEAEIGRVLKELLIAAHGDRTTLRIDDPARGWQVNFAALDRAGAEIKHLAGIRSDSPLRIVGR